MIYVLTVSAMTLHRHTKDMFFCSLNSLLHVFFVFFLFLFCSPLASFVTALPACVFSYLFSFTCPLSSFFPSVLSLCFSLSLGQFIMVYSGSLSLCFLLEPYPNYYLPDYLPFILNHLFDKYHWTIILLPFCYSLSFGWTQKQMRMG